MPVRRSFAVRWSDTDANGHVRHTIYAEMGVESRMSWLDQGGFGWAWFEERGLGPVLLEERIEYLRELGIGETVQVDMVLCGGSADGGRWRMRHTVTRASGETAARVTALGGWIDLRARRLALPPPELAAYLRSGPRSDDFEVLPPLRRQGP
ncbi:MAG TPA: acyl-CoA thioesterase [Anaeromyxobacteraceae bacterium]|nr:acyl-CoA thioesterase [Anaeromyxobacteraceae bacterium]